MNTTRTAAPKVTFGKFSHPLSVNEPCNGEKAVYLNGVQVGTIELRVIRYQRARYSVDLWSEDSEPTFPTLAEAADYCRATLIRKA